MWIAPADFAQQFEPVAVGKAHVEQKEVKGIFLEHGEAALAGFGAHRRIALGAEEKFQALANFGFVVDD